MKKIALFFCLGALLIIFGSYGMAFASTSHVEPGGERSADDLNYITDPGDGELLYGLFTVNRSGGDDVVHCILYKKGELTIKEKDKRIEIKAKGDDYHLFSFQTDHLDFCAYDVSTLEAGLLLTFYAQPYLSRVDEAFGFTRYDEYGDVIYPIGVPVLEDLKIIRLENCDDDTNGNEMIFGYIVVRVFEYSPPE